MGLKADKKYHGTVAPGSALIESSKGTLGYQVQLECEDGPTSYTIWLTPATRETATETFVKSLGVDEKKLKDGNYIEMQLGLDIDGREVTFTTEENEYKGKVTVKVKGLYKRNASAGGPLGKVAGQFFGAGSGKVTTESPITDADVPF